MPAATVETFTAAAKSNVEKLTSVTKDHTEALTKSSNAAIAGFTKLAKAYQELAARHVETLTTSIQALSSVKTPVEFFEVQQKLMKEAFETTITDSRAIAELTASAFAATFEPVQKQFSAIQGVVKKAP
jgi:phasin family protein